MATFAELVAEVTGIVPGYSQFLAQRDLGKAFRDILDRRTWSFQLAEGGFTAPAIISAGSVSITQFSPIVTADVTAGAALNAVVAATPVLTKRQFRLGNAGAIYNITAWDNGTLQLTLDRPILEATNATQTYEVYECYYPPPPESLLANGYYDFRRWLSVIDPITPIVLTVHTGKRQLDWRDPQRSSVGMQAYDIYDYKPDAIGNPYYEFWPHPTAQEFVCLYVKAGFAFTMGFEALPRAIPDALLVDRCLTRYAYRWAQINAGRNPHLQKTNWGVMIQQGSQQWERDLQVAKLQDENIFLQALIGPTRRRWPFPVDSAFIQAHDVNLIR